MRVPDAVEPSLVVEIHGVSDQGVSLPMPNRVSHPGGAESGVMRAAVREDLMPHGVPLEKHDDLAGNLSNLQWEWVKKNPREAGWTTVAKNGVVCFRERNRARSEGGLGSFVFRLAPSGHGRLFQVQLINPVPLLDGVRPGTVFHPDP